MMVALLLCAVATVHDGDTLRCTDGTRIRIAGIDAPELEGCQGRTGRICVPGNGQASRRYLEQLAARQTLRCRPNGTSYQRVTAFCVNERGIDLSCAMVASGYAIRWDRYWGRHRCGQ